MWWAFPSTVLMHSIRAGMSIGLASASSTHALICDLTSSSITSGVPILKSFVIGLRGFQEIVAQEFAQLLRVLLARLVNLLGLARVAAVPKIISPFLELVIFNVGITDQRVEDIVRARLLAVVPGANPVGGR